MECAALGTYFEPFIGGVIPDISMSEFFGEPRPIIHEPIYLRAFIAKKGKGNLIT